MGCTNTPSVPGLFDLTGRGSCLIEEAQYVGVALAIFRFQHLVKEISNEVRMLVREAHQVVLGVEKRREEASQYGVGADDTGGLRVGRQRRDKHEFVFGDEQQEASR